MYPESGGEERCCHAVLSVCVRAGPPCDAMRPPQAARCRALPRARVQELPPQPELAEVLRRRLILGHHGCGHKVVRGEGGSRQVGGPFVWTVVCGRLGWDLPRKPLFLSRNIEGADGPGQVVAGDLPLSIAAPPPPPAGGTGRPCRAAGPSSRPRTHVGANGSWGGEAGESFLRVHWVAVPEAVRARRANSSCGGWW
eukprot:COSAG01_NODE_13080_length_1639_cov_1.027273_1_plen_196_part_10